MDCKYIVRPFVNKTNKSNSKNVNPVLARLQSLTIIYSKLIKIVKPTQYKRNFA